jgi:hypothetical protein
MGAKLAVAGYNVLIIAGENVEGMAERSIAWRHHNNAKPSNLYTVSLPVKLNDSYKDTSKDVDASLVELAMARIMWYNYGVVHSSLG